MDEMDIYVSPDEDESDTIPTTVAKKLNPRRVVEIMEESECYMNCDRLSNVHPLVPEQPDQDIRHSPTPTLPKRDNVTVTLGLPDEPLCQQHTRVPMETVEHLDMKDRDPTDMNKHVRVWFEDVLAEPEGMHSFDRIWRFSFVTFMSVKTWSYRICTLLCAVPCSICWGLYFAWLTFLHIWFVVPCIKSCIIVLHWASKMWTLCIRTFCDPCFESLARVFSNIHFTNYRQ